MSRPLNTADTLGLGFMLLAFFLGAGNWIFPPMAGQQAGHEVLPATLGFLITAVGLPLLGVISLAAARGGLAQLGRYLPAGASLLLALAIYIVMVPGFGIPRTALVAFEMGFKPFFTEVNQDFLLAGFSLGYFSLTFWLALNPSKLLNRIGKFIAPLMLVLIAVLGYVVFTAPLAPIGEGQGEFVATPFTKGFLEGYMTMDLLAAMLFGVLIINTLKDKGVEAQRHQYSSLILGGSIAAIGLACVYIILFYMGATSHSVAPGAANGGEVFTLYMSASMGLGGQLVLAFVVGLACLTTAVGGTSACAEYFVERWPKLSYRPTLFVLVAICTLVANIGLSALIGAFIPVLFAVYPLAIVLVLLNLSAKWLPAPTRTFCWAAVFALLFGLCDAARFLGILDKIPGIELLDSVPLFDLGLGWVVPVLLVVVLTVIGPREEAATETSAVQDNGDS
ncbi:branched-chain amino acid transport system II carrier protein [Corallincola spongiicola]|uniref:Branched-chain amino acid transport system carrier protein n=1 Tax=Corallincola spongiicola TaxID=2520508 RepID=A0ABY1WRH3_9GAMM|nr:branched-chain amino acid transport system II carrier protein [Corallincola spongiicola]TAA47318.1 branched-chain amino acid transport system II carrier protein [Corallincola spongiicola]